MSETITFTLIKSGIGSTKKINATLVGLGLTKMNKTVTRKNEICKEKQRVDVKGA